MGFDIIYTLGLIFGGMYLENRFAPRIKIIDKAVCLVYKATRTATTTTNRKIFSL